MGRTVIGLLRRVVGRTGSLRADWGRPLGPAQLAGCKPAAGCNPAPHRQIDLAFFSIFLQKVEHVRAGAQLGVAAEGVARLEKLRDGGGWVRRVAENHGFEGAHLDARRLEAARQALVAEGALFDHALFARGICRVDGAQKRPRVAPVEAARAVGAGGQAITAADAAVLIHHHQAVALALPGGAGGAYLDTRRMFAVIAEQRDGSAGDGGAGVFLAERIFEALFPDPLDFAAGVGNPRYVVGRVAGLRAAGAAAVSPAPRQVDGHGHTARFGERARSGGQQREKGFAGDLHRGLRGSTWQFQHSGATAAY